MSDSDPRLVHEDVKSDAFGLHLGSRDAFSKVSKESSSFGSGSTSEKSSLAERAANSENNNNEQAGNEVDGNICSQEGRQGEGKKESAKVVGTAKPESEQRPRSSKPSGTDSSEDMADYGQELIQLPKTFVVKYLGQEDASGLWGIKYTRKPVDEMVSAAKILKLPATLPVVKLEVSLDGIKISSSGTGSKGKSDVIEEEFPIDTISYGVQDLVYTRVFAVIIVRESDNVVEKHPFRCYGFVCDSRGNARRLTLALAKAFQEFSKALKSASDADPTRKVPLMRPKKLAIDLRSADEIKKDLIQEEDSEA